MAAVLLKEHQPRAVRLFALAAASCPTFSEALFSLSRLRFFSSFFTTIVDSTCCCFFRFSGKSNEISLRSTLVFSSDCVDRRAVQKESGGRWVEPFTWFIVEKPTPLPSIERSLHAQDYCRCNREKVAHGLTSL